MAATELQTLRVAPWMRGLLLLAGFYNLGWGFFIYHFPNSFYRWVTMADRPAPDLIEWQGLGVLFFGLVYLLVAVYPIRLWFLLAVGLVSKMAGALGFYLLVMESTFNKKFLFHIIMNDLVWVVPFGIILWRMIKVIKMKKVRFL